MEFPKSLTYGYRRYFCLKLVEDPEFETLSFEPDEGIWQEAEFTQDFVDIEGENKRAPWFDTRVKIRWSERGLYFLAIMQGDEVWANVKGRDEVIFQDNDFEIFLDPDDDTHAYIELEINAINTVWDLLLTKPYRIGGLPLNSFDIKGLKTKTYISKNDRGDVLDWRALIFWPFESILEVNRIAGNNKFPEIGDYYRINFSRVHWNTERVGGDFVKLKDCEACVLPEENWVWSEQGLINMHYPEKWGFLYFCDESSIAVIREKAAAYLNSEVFKIKSFLWELWYLTHDYMERGYDFDKGEFELDEIIKDASLSIPSDLLKGVSINFVKGHFMINFKSEKVDLSIDQDGLFS